VLLRRAGAGHHGGREARLSERRPFGVDGAVVPGLLLLVARDLVLHDPPRVLAWRLTHDPALAAAVAWLGPLLPAPSGALDRDPVALLLAGLAALLALGYALMAAAGARPAARAAVVALAATVLVVLPSAAFLGMGAATGRPYGQDGGVVQLPLAIDKILAGESPYGADYSSTVLARQARASSFWDEWGGNPILHHHAYLPGTHLVMLPFHLASRAAFGGFDPRVVTLLFYVLVAMLAARLPASAEDRLAAAGVAALNPLVYWHQIFGANDLVFVAMVLGAVLLARSGRPVACGALLGLACATKQLAWPFAPFLLVALSGARSFRDLARAPAWRRLVPPLAAAGAVFLAVVLPVAALDFRAFWGDIVVYNVGLPGGDNYPLGGTPGFGFANYLVYFGRVASLRDYFPFSAFYALLVPLALLLLRAQLREGRPEWALATGSAALLASLYFSRVVHPNYLIPAAVVLPLAVLALRRGADVALAPLLLLTVAVEVAEHAVLRTTWEQAVAAGLPARLSGLAAVFVPEAGPALTRDPLGLVFSATAAGLGVLYLALAVCGAPRRSRLAVTALAAALVVGVPALVLARVSGRTGVVRAQDPAVVQAQADAGRLVAERSPYTPPPETSPRGREAFSVSFRLDPPAEILPARPLLPPGASVAAGLTRAIGARDLRLATASSLAVLALFLAASLEGRRRRTALALVLLSAPLAVGTVLGSPLALSLAALVGAWAAGRRGAPLASGLLAGAAVATAHEALLVAPFLLRSGADGRGRRRAILAAVAAYVAVVAPVALLDPGGFAARLGARAAPGPGLGLFDLFAYRGAEASAGALALAAFSPLLLAILVIWLLGRPWPALARGGIASLGAIVLAPAVSAEAVALPIVLLAMAALGVGEGSEGNGNKPS
jgi:Glycosyltransferase family 87